MAMQAQTVAPEVVSQLRIIVEKLFSDGQRWVKGIDRADWRRQRYVGDRARRAVGSGPSVANVVDWIPPVLGYLEKEASGETASLHNYLIVKPDSQCLDDKGIALLRPVLKRDKDDRPQINFHIWFHVLSPQGSDDHLMLGWRLESPEGDATTHDFFHAQPLRKYGVEEAVHGLHARHPERFPSIPLPASNCVELCLTAVLVACGKEALRDFVRSSDPAVRAASRGFWDKVFVGEGRG